MTLDGVEPIAVAFANTACPDSACACELASFRNVVAMLARIGALDARQSKRLQIPGARQEKACVAEVLAFRRAVIALLEAVRTNARVRDADLERVNAILARTPCRELVKRTDDGIVLRRTRTIAGSEDMLALVAQSVAETLATVDPTRLKRCKEPDCACYFIDTSKNRTRAWCSMQRCGNRAKVATYYRRSRGASAERAAV